MSFKNGINTKRQLPFKQMIHKKADMSLMVINPVYFETCLLCCVLVSESFAAVGACTII